MATHRVSDFSRLIHPRIALHPCFYISCLAAQASGVHYGGWVYANQSVDKLICAIEQVLTGSPKSDSKASAIQHFEGFGPTPPPLSASLETISALASFFAHYGKLGAAVLAHLEDVDGKRLSEARNLLENHYCGAFRNKNAFVESEYRRDSKLLEDLEDYDILADHWFMYTYFSLAVEGKEHVFERSVT